MKSHKCAAPPSCSSLLQVSALADLEELELQNCSYSASSMAGLSALHALTDLEFVACSAAPTELASMTQLHRLAVTRGGDAGAMPGIDAALSSLTRLTELWLAGSYASALPALPALSQLDSLAVLLPRPAPTATDDEVAPPAPPALPLGPWIGSLTELNVNWPLLANSVLALQQATSLEFVGVQSVPDPNDGPSESWDSAFDWLARHPPLRECRLCLDPLEDVLNFAAFDALMRLKDRRPSLLVGRVDAEFLPLE